MDDWEKIFEMISLDQKGLYNQLLSLAAFFNIFLSAIFGGLILLVYVVTSGKSKIEKSLTTTIPLLSILMTVLMSMKTGHIAIFFGIFGVLSIVRFRSTLTEQKAIAFILFAIITGVLIGMGNYLLVLLAFITITIVIIIINMIFNSKNMNKKTVLFSFSSEKDLKTTQTEIEEFFKVNNITFIMLEISARMNFNKKKNATSDDKRLDYKIFIKKQDDIALLYDLIKNYFRDKEISIKLYKTNNTPVKNDINDDDD